MTPVFFIAKIYLSLC